MDSPRLRPEKLLVQQENSDGKERELKTKMAAIAAAAPLALMLTTGTALATSYAVPAEPGTSGQYQYQGDVDLACVTLLGPDASPEELQTQAQAILDEDSSDPNGLDADADDVACELDETPTGELAFEDGSGHVSSDGVLVDIEDAGPSKGGFHPTASGENLACVTVLGPGAAPEEIQQEAQAIYDADPADPNGLDANGNGMACEFSQEATGTVTFEDGSGFVADSAQQQEPEPHAEKTPETASPAATPAPKLKGTLIDEAVPSSISPEGFPAPASRTPRELPATGGAPVLPISGGPVTAGTALVGTALLAFAARRRPPGV